MMKKDIKTYSELAKLHSFNDRFNYLRLSGSVGKDTFGFDRWMNQKFYKSREWKQVRDYVIVRDNGCDLGDEGHQIFGKILIHHMNPISPDDIAESTDILLNPEYLICVSHKTHNAIHYGINDLMVRDPEERRVGDTKLW